MGIKNLFCKIQKRIDDSLFILENYLKSFKKVLKWKINALVLFLYIVLVIINVAKCNNFLFLIVTS